MKQLRHGLAIAVVTGLLAPVLCLALTCQAPGASAMAAMNCCRTMQSSCMHGEFAGTETCCQNVVAQPLTAVHATNSESGVPALVPAARAAAAIAAAVPPSRRSIAATLSPTPPPVPLYALHASRLI